MTTIQRTALIDASLEEVWVVLADFALISAWAGFVDHACLLNERTEGIGMARRIQTGRTTIVETVTSWEPAVAYSYEITGLPPVVKSVTNTWRLGASGDATMVWLTTEIDAGSRPPQKAIAKALGRKLGQSSDEMLAGLSAFLKVNAE
jgi:hypothetical protein